MTISRADKAIEYANDARNCLKIVERLADRESRIVQREMAAEWLMLAGHAAGQGLTSIAEATSLSEKYG